MSQTPFTRYVIGKKNAQNSKVGYERQEPTPQPGITQIAFRHFTPLHDESPDNG